MGILISIGRYGGFYISLNSFGKRIYLGWVAVTFYPVDGDQLILAASNWMTIEKSIKENGHATLKNNDDGIELLIS